MQLKCIFFICVFELELKLSHVGFELQCTLSASFIDFTDLSQIFLFKLTDEFVVLRLG